MRMLLVCCAVFCPCGIVFGEELNRSFVCLVLLFIEYVWFSSVATCPLGFVVVEELNSVFVVVLCM